LRRILYVEEAPAFGGSTSTLLHLVKRLDRGRYEPFVLFRYALPARESFAASGISVATMASITGADDEAPRIETSPETPAHKKTPSYRLLSSMKKYAARHRGESFRLARWMRSEGFALIHTNNSVSTNLGALVGAARAGVPAVSHQRGFFRLTAFHRLLARRVERFVCVSNAVRDHYIGEGLPAGLVQTVYDGVDLAALVPRAPARNERVLVGWFARFERWKGCDQFVEAARIVLARRHDAEFIMAGAGPEEPNVRSRVESDPAFAARFHLPGFRKDALDLMAGCDIVVNSSIEPEPLSNTALEALALGRPVVASNRGGNPEIVDHGVNGLLYDTMDPESLAAALLRLVEDEALRRRFGAAGRARAESLFDAEAYSRGIQSLYAEILDA
jgi:glycosyltransferase involved in cell wall biosynthesis